MMTERKPGATPCRFTRASCGDLVQSERREWWIANGLGAYAGGTVAGSLTRRYHGLLIAPIASPLVTGAGLFSLTIRAPNGTIAPKRDWYRDFDLPVEAERGLESTDNHLCMGEVTGPSNHGQTCPCLATYRVGGDATAALDLLAAISDVIEDQAVGTIGEICDGDPPHQPRGAPVQAWSVACTLDAWRTLRQIEGHHAADG